MDNKIITKILALALAFILTFTNVLLLGIYTHEAIAASIELENQSTEVKKSSIEFDAYFKEGEEQKHVKDIDVALNNDKLYMQIKVEAGYLKGGVIKLENANFSLVQAEKQSELIQDINVENNTITLNNINDGESVVLEIPIKMNADSSFNVENLDKISDIVLEGTYVNIKGKEISISKTIELSANIKADAKANLTSEVSKYVQFDVNGKKGVILQNIIKSNLLDNILPVKQTELEIEIPKINKVVPQTVVLSSIGTKATNGKLDKVFTQEDYKYEDGKVTLNIKNEIKEDGTISWEKDAQDEILLTCVYDEKAIIDVADVDIKVNSKIMTYNNEELIVEGNLEDKVSLTEKIGDIVSFGIKTDKEKIQKGYMLVKDSPNTPYVETWSANIGNKELLNSIIFENNAKYVDANQNEFEALPLYTYTKVSSEQFTKILGEEGYINIYNKEGTKIATLNKDNLEYRYETETTYIKIETSKPQIEGILNIENGKEIKSSEYDRMQKEAFTKLNTKLLGTVLNGDKELLRGELQKELILEEPITVIDTTISNQNLSTSELNEKVELKLTLNTNDVTKNLYKNPRVIVEFPTYIEEISDGKIGLLYNNELQISNSRIYKNEKGNTAIEIQMQGEQTTFNTSSVSNGTTIFMSLSMKVDELAPNIQDNIKVYVQNENKSTYNMVENEMGLFKIPVKYAALNKIITRNTISGYNQENAEIKALDEAKTAVIKPKAEAKNAVVKLDMVNSTNKDITNVMILGRTPFEGNKSITSGNDLNSKFTANMIGAISSTYGIDSQNITIYYSTNGDATNDLNNTQNAWTKEVKDFSKVKSYLIVLGDKIIEVGNRLSFAYNIQIPENIGGELGTNSTFAVYYNEIEKVAEEVAPMALDMEGANTNNQVTSNVLKVEEANTVGLMTEKIYENPQDENNNQTPDVGNNQQQENLEAFNSEELDVNVKMSTSGKSLTNNEQVKEGQYVDYTVNMENKSKTKKLVFDLVISKQNGTFYGPKIVDYTIVGNEPIHSYEELEDETFIKRITIEPGKKETFTYTLIANKNTKDSDLISEVAVKQNNNVIKKESTTNKIAEGDLKLNITVNKTEENTIYSKGSSPILITVENITDKKLSNVEVQFELPELLEYQDNPRYEADSDYDSVDSSTRTLKYKINELEVGKKAYIFISTNVKDIDINAQKENIQIMAKANANGKEYLSNIYNREIKQGRIEVKASMTGSVLDEYVKDGQEIIYTIDIENKGILDENYLDIQDILPNGLKAQSYTIIDSEGKETTRSTNYDALVIQRITLKAKSHMKVKIKAKVVAVLADTENITNNASITGRFFDKVTTNSVTYKIKDFDDIKNPTKPDKPTTPDNPDNPSNPSTPDEPNNPDIQTKNFYIEGTVWNDANTNGKKDNDEKTLEGVKVMLMNNKTSEFVKDSKGKELILTTSKDGKYKFENLLSGEYIVVFMYDTLLYTVTTYQKSGVNSNENSDAIDGTLKIGGIDTKVATTDVITLGQANIANIDLGLISSKTFDLKLDKVVSTVIVQNKQGTKTYTFKNNKTAKVEIPSKYMIGSNITVEYKIRVTNEGNVSGTVGRIADYVPKGLQFSSDINHEWYKGTDGSVYTTELANTEIKPGETKEVSLVLTKTLKEEAAEIINNTAEIAEAHNSLGIEDIDSTPGNKDQKEDDFANADLIITIKTGVLTYTLIILATAVLVGVLGTGIYFIKKKVLIEKM